jgi:hypothetical protein
MSDVFETNETRRGFVKWVGRIGIATVGAVAGVTAMQESARADGFCDWKWCCCLKFPHNSSCINTCNQTSGYVLRSWTCCYFQFQHRYRCYECVKSTVSSCWDANGSNTLCSQAVSLGWTIECT